MIALSDPSQLIRQDEGLDAVALEAFLRSRRPGLKGRMTIKPFPSGFSNLTAISSLKIASSCCGDRLSAPKPGGPMP
jgi:hypothetical protein